MNYDFLAFLFIFIVLTFFAIRRHLEARKMKNWNFDWYVKEFPNLHKGGRVSCYKCKSPSIGVERMMNQTYMRRHVCRQCGTTLYYSSEN